METRGDAAALAAAVLDEEAARQEAQERAREQVIFPDDLLPGVNSEPVTFREAFARTFGQPPGRSRQADAIVTDWVESPLGPLVVAATDGAICLLEFSDRQTQG